MPCKPTHQLVNAAAAAAYYIYRRQQPGSRPIPHPMVGISGATILASLPDFVEPAIHPNHRQFFHSILFALGVGMAVYEAYHWKPESTFEEIIRGLILIGGSAYLLHLVADALTRKSIPLVGKL